MDLNKSINLAKSFLNYKLIDSLNIEYLVDNSINGLSVVKNGNKLTIKAKKKSDVFRAITLVKENNGKDFSTTFESNFDSNGVMIDCSRNGVVKVSQLKKIILQLALMGLDRLLLYTEDTYELDGYPYFGYLRGGYSKQDLKDLVAFGSQFGVELIPCIQTLDHLEKPLRWGVFDEIKEGDSNLMPNTDKTYQFIEAMIKTCRECFNTNEIHIGMDESFRLGTGKYLSTYGYHDRVELFSEHLAKVLTICKKYNFEPMIWSDMYFRLNDKNSEYYSCIPLPESTLKLIHKDVSLVYWDYYHEEKEIYDKMFKNHLATKCKIYFAGGSWRWSGFTPSLHKSYLFNELALQSAKENGVKNVFVTAWGDNGNECSIYTILLSLAQYSAAHYYKEYSDKEVNLLLEAVTGETKERMFLLDLPNMPDKRVLAAPYNPSKFLFYQDPLLGLFDKQVKDNFSGNYKEFADILLKCSKESKYYSYVYLNLSNLSKALELKADLGVKLRKAYKGNNLKELEELKNSTIPELIKRLDVFHDSLEYQWNKENRRFGFDVLDGRIGYLKARLISTINVLNDYLNKKIDKIEELEKEILPYGGYDYEICWNDWIRNVAV